MTTSTMTTDLRLTTRDAQRFDRLRTMHESGHQTKRSWGVDLRGIPGTRDLAIVMIPGISEASRTVMQIAGTRVFLTLTRLLGAMAGMLFGVAVGALLQPVHDATPLLGIGGGVVGFLLSFALETRGARRFRARMGIAPRVPLGAVIERGYRGSAPIFELLDSLEPVTQRWIDRDLSDHGYQLVIVRILEAIRTIDHPSAEIHAKAARQAIDAASPIREVG